MFFATSWKGERVLTGYYDLHWYAKGVLAENDFCLAANHARFIEQPIPLPVLDRKCNTNVSGWFRGVRLLTSSECLRVLEVLNEFPDKTADYLDEIDRLERFNLKHTGYRYPSFRKTDKFSWETAPSDLLAGSAASKLAKQEKVLNTSPSGLWKCDECSKLVKNKALLKRCPNCGTVGTLRPSARG
ncbi:MAG TPA: hypothetical protein DC054_16025 [Blastocatellia bacterium]|nr:hypothetical protein [Blastocatellia bacterium]